MQRLRVLTWNLWANTLPWQGWQKRREAVFRLLLSQAPDVFGLQEVTLVRIREIQGQMPGYEWVGEPRDGSVEAEYNPIFYAKDRCELLHHRTKWLSPTPEVSSRGWDATYPRTLVQTHFLRRNTERTPFLLWNTHLDHWGVKAQAHSVQFIINQIEGELPGLPLILMGDFNFKPSSRHYRMITGVARLQDTAMSGATAEWTKGKTWQGLPGTAIGAARLDYIFIRNLAVNHYQVLRGMGAKASDHYAVRAEVDLCEIDSL